MLRLTGHVRESFVHWVDLFARPCLTSRHIQSPGLVWQVSRARRCHQGLRWPRGLSCGAVHLPTWKSGRCQTSNASHSASRVHPLSIYASGGPGKQRCSNHSHWGACRWKVETRHTFIYFNNLMRKPEVGTPPRKDLNGLPTAKSFLFLWFFLVHMCSKLESRVPRVECV